MRRMWVIVFGFVFIAGACQDYDDSGEWNGWLDFETKALSKGAVCGDSSYDSVVDFLSDDHVLLIRSMYIAADLWGEFRELVACKEKAKNCEEYWRCKIPEGAGICDRDSFEEYCDGDVAVNCSYRNTNSEEQYFIIRKDCAAAPVSGSCVIMSGDAFCSYDLCNQEDNMLCTEDDVSIACENHDYEDLLWMMDCPSMGMKCLENGLCGIPDAITCGDPEGPWFEVCDGHYIHHCNILGAFSEDCREMDQDFVCLLDEDDEAYCSMPEGEWECTEHGSRWCEGSELRVCIYGKIVSYDCASFEEAQCEGDVCVLPD